MSIKIVHRTLPPLQHWEGLLIPVHISDGSRGGAREALAPSLFFDQTEARKAEKNFGGTPPLSQGLDPTLHMHMHDDRCIVNCLWAGAHAVTL